MNDRTKSGPSGKPAKPYPTFPLFPLFTKSTGESFLHADLHTFLEVALFARFGAGQCTLELEEAEEAKIPAVPQAFVQRSVSLVASKAAWWCMRQPAL